MALKHAVCKGELQRLPGGHYKCKTCGAIVKIGQGRGRGYIEKQLARSK